MGAFSFGLLRPRSQRQATLPLYEKLSHKRASAAGESPLSSDDEDTEGEADYSSPSSSPTSRQTSSSLSSNAAMLPRSPFRLARRPGRPIFYRLPNKIVRYLCIGLVMTIVLFIFGLVRASIAENRRVGSGDVNKKPPPPPPWESFEFLTRYYGGVRTLLPLKDSVPQYPRDEDEQPFNISDVRPEHTSPNGEEHKIESTVPPSKAFASEYPSTALTDLRGQVQECFLDAKNTVRVPLVRYLEGRPAGFPQHVLGSYELMSLPEDICFERFGRYGPYGFGYSVRNGGLGIGEHGEREGAEAVWGETRRVDYRQLDWAEVQRRCYQSNAQRFKPLEPRPVSPYGFYISEQPETATLAARDVEAPRPEETAPGPADEPKTFVQSSRPAQKQHGDLPRTAIVVRVWDEFLFREEDVMNLRSLITEAALASGGRYDVHLLVQVRDDAKYPIWADDNTYRQRIKDAIPDEFQGLATLWTVTQMLSLYQGIHDLYSRGPDLPVHGSYRGLQMAMQYFAYKHPEYDFFWQWEMDIRYTGHYYDLFAKMEDWAREQPRKGLWERNARFYLPAVHGSWEDFKQMARTQTEMGSTGPDTMWDGIKGGKAPQAMARGEETIWGPRRPADEEDWLEPENDPVPPTTYSHDKYTWGVGEEADYITLNPMFDPEGTTWLLADDITGYNETRGKPPRRAQIITASRMSRRLLLSMHRETALKKHHAFPEMWPATAALHHGYKAVFAPHPVYTDREWPTEYMARVYNAGRNGASGGARASVFGQREHNLRGLTWFYDSGFAPNLYRRWLGLKVNNDGGEEFELTPDMSKNDTAVGLMRGGEGRMCLPPMLLHPVKGVELPVEADDLEEAAVPESDPAA